MRITINFFSLKDLSDLSNGEKLLEILSSYGLVIEKAGEYEPIRKEFTLCDFPQIWKGRGKAGSPYKSCDFLFKGKKEISFSGSASWNLGLPPNTNTVQGVCLWLTITKKYDVSRIIRLADELFIWSEAVYGYVTEDSKNISRLRRYINERHSVSFGNVYSGIPGLLWVNYFGVPYLKEEDFRLPENSTKVGHGAKLILTERPDDERLSDLNFLKFYTKQIGSEWFYPIEKIEGNKCFMPKNFQEQDIKIPLFDNSAIVRQESD